VLDGRRVDGKITLISLPSDSVAWASTAITGQDSPVRPASSKSDGRIPGSHRGRSTLDPRRGVHHPLRDGQPVSGRSISGHRASDRRIGLDLLTGDNPRSRGYRHAEPSEVACQHPFTAACGSLGNGVCDLTRGNFWLLPWTSAADLFAFRECREVSGSNGAGIRQNAPHWCFGRLQRGWQPGRTPPRSFRGRTALAGPAASRLPGPPKPSAAMPISPLA
jgi:hypothetical protein